MFRALRILWDFGRPHTVIASFISITTLYLLVVSGADLWDHLSIYAFTLVSALGCNVFITGLNQITDVELDKENKAFLPIARGDLSIERAQMIIWVALGICLLFASLVSWWMLGIMALIAAIGYAYSAPPIRLKKHHLPAALSIVVVRGVLVNLGIGWILEYIITGDWGQVDALIPLTIFVSAYSFAIAWFKDLYDVKGDEQHQIKTLPVLYSISAAFRYGSGLVIAAYIATLVYALQYMAEGKVYIIAAHGVLLTLFLFHVLRANISTREGIYRFYMRFWVFFFAEYAVFMGYGILL